MTVPTGIYPSNSKQMVNTISALPGWLYLSNDQKHGDARRLFEKLVSIQQVPHVYRSHASRQKNVSIQQDIVFLNLPKNKNLSF